MKSTIVLAALLTAAPLVLTAQSSARPQTREGFTIAFGVGTGSLGAKCDICSNDRQSSATGFLRIGGTVRPNLIIAGEGRGWQHDVDAGTTATVSFLLADALYYPQPQNGWYLEGGLGAGQYKNESSGSEFTSTGLALSIGTGYDFRVAKSFSLTPFVSWSGTGGAKVKQNGTSTDSKFDVNLFQIGLGFTWH